MKIGNLGNESEATILNASEQRCFLHLNTTNTRFPPRKNGDQMNYELCFDAKSEFLCQKRKAGGKQKL